MTDSNNSSQDSAPPQNRRNVQRGRTSPSHTLKDAIDGVQRVFESLGTVSHSREAVSEALGYKPGSGAVNSKIGSLTHFGLLKRSGAQYAVSDLARRIIQPRDGNEKKQAVSDAVCSPSLYNELIQQYDDQPLPPMLSNILSRQYGVAPKNAPIVASRFEDSISYAGLLRDGKVFANLSSGDSEISPTTNENNNEAVVDKADNRNIQTNEIGPAADCFNIPLRKGRVAILQIARPVDESDLDRIKQWIDLMADVLTEEEVGIHESGDQGGQTHQND